MKYNKYLIITLLIFISLVTTFFYTKNIITIGIKLKLTKHSTIFMIYPPYKYNPLTTIIST